MKKILFPLILMSLLFYLASCNNSDDAANKQGEIHTMPELKSIFINGDSIHYIDVGKGDPVVFIHGTLGDYRTWQGQTDEFAKNYRIIAYSRRFAKPNKQTVNDSADYTVIPHARDLAEFIKSLHFEQPVHLIGHSYGAFAALLTAKDHPELVRSLTLGEPPVASLLQYVRGGDTVLNNFITNAIMPAAEEFKNNNNEKAVTIFIGGVMGDSMYFSKIPPEGRAIMMDNTLELRGSVFTKDLFPAITCDDLKKIKPPVLLLKGDRSPLFFTAITDELNRCLSNKETATLPNASHGLEYENPAEFNKIVIGFIDKH